jgi:hypothetical protein
MEVEVVGLGDGSQILDEFDSKFLILQRNMNNEKLLWWSYLSFYF